MGRLNGVEKFRVAETIGQWIVWDKNRRLNGVEKFRVAETD